MGFGKFLACLGYVVCWFVCFAGCVCARTTFSTFYLHWDDCVLQLLRVRFTYGTCDFSRICVFN